MSVRHLEQIKAMVQGEIHGTIPTAPILMLPDRLQFVEEYDPTAFGTPGGAPRMLGPEYPVIVDGAFTFVFVVTDGMCTFVKLEDKG